MIKTITNFIRLLASGIIIIMSVAVMAGCSSYRLGDVSRIYCGATSEEIRADIKAQLTDKGIRVSVDYCASVGLIDEILKGRRYG